MGSQLEKKATAAYVETMLAELRSMSQTLNADFLAYLIEMAMVEASEVAKGKPEPIDAMDSDNSVEMARLYMVGELE